MWVVPVVRLVDPFKCDRSPLSPIDSKFGGCVFRKFVMHSVHVSIAMSIGRGEWAYSVDVDCL